MRNPIWSVAVMALVCTGSVGARIDTVVDDRAWCWFQDERAIVHQGTVYVATIASGGDIGVSQFDTESGSRLTAIVHEGLQENDHAVPALLLLPDGYLMVFYSKHNGDRFYSWRTTSPYDASDWTSVGEFLSGTYADPHLLSEENDAIHFFCRMLGWQPTHALSADRGTSWSEPAKALQGIQRPYVKYVSDHKRRIHLAYTETHPRNYETSIYHTSFMMYTGASSSSRATRGTQAQSFRSPETHSSRTYTVHGRQVRRGCSSAHAGRVTVRDGEAHVGTPPPAQYNGSSAAQPAGNPEREVRP